ncbi:MAG: hypothetical protein IT522_17865 [Burkholderiales bacterium]|nr:hypothetical protein [Burkholderiales bacterium]
MQHRPYAAVTIAEIGGHDDPKRPVTINRNDRSRSPKYARKHANDVLRLSQLLAPDTRIPVAERIAQDLSRFLDAIETDRSIDRSEAAQDQQKRRRDCRPDRAGLRLESTARDVIAAQRFVGPLGRSPCAPFPRDRSYRLATENPDRRPLRRVGGKNWARIE